MGLRTTVIALLLAALVLPAPVAAGSAKGGKKTHLGVTPKRVVNVHTFALLNDNSGGHLFYYDREFASPFSVPEGYSFVVTDIFIKPDVATVNATQQTFVVVDLGGRSFSAHYASAETRHFALAGAMVVPGGVTPTGRNVTDSTQYCDVQMLGYFVKATALSYGESPFPAP